MGVIKLLFQAMQTCRELALQFALVGNAQIVSECKGFEDTRNWVFYGNCGRSQSQLGQGCTNPNGHGLSQDTKKTKQFCWVYCVGRAACLARRPFVFGSVDQSDCSGTAGPERLLRPKQARMQAISTPLHTRKTSAFHFQSL